MAELRQMAGDLRGRMEKLEMTSERHPKTTGAAWDHLLDTLEHEAVCYRYGNDPDGDLRPIKGDMNYGEAVYNAVETLQESGRLTREQIMAVSQLCAWVARAARC
jgi:hypothetical protein